MSRTRVVLNLRGFRDLRRSPEVEADLLARGRRIAAAAGPGYGVQTWLGRNRARVTVRTSTPETRRAETENPVLLNSLDAGR